MKSLYQETKAKLKREKRGNLLQFLPSAFVWLNMDHGGGCVFVKLAGPFLRLTFRRRHVIAKVFLQGDISLRRGLPQTIVRLCSDKR